MIGAVVLFAELLLMFLRGIWVILGRWVSLLPRSSRRATTSGGS